MEKLVHLDLHALLFLAHAQKNENITGNENIVDAATRLLKSSASAVFSTLWGQSADEEEALRLAEIERQEREFHSFVRQQIIFLLFFISLYFISYWIISRFKSKSDNDSLYSGEEDYFVYRISVWICTFSLATSVGSIALLPFSVMGAELIQQYPGNYYLQWLSWSLINNLWNYVFILSNLSLFVLLPFCYFFIESSGFGKGKNGIMQRVYETLAVCALLIVVVLCLGDLVLTLAGSTLSLLSITSVNLPLIYSCVSLFGVVLLLISTPIGFGRMFSVVGEMAMQTPSVDLDDSAIIARLERNYAQYKNDAGFLRKGANSPQKNVTFRKRNGECNGYGGAGDAGLPILSGYGISGPKGSNSMLEAGDATLDTAVKKERGTAWELLSGGVRSSRVNKFWVPLRDKSLRWYQQVMNSIKYPLIICGLLVLTGISLLMVLINTLKLTFGYRSLPVYAQYIEVQTRHTLGMVGVTVEITIILYIMATSLVGVYSIPFVRSFRPKPRGTSMTAIIINCSLVLVLSSALPVLANTLGITTFDLLGAYSALQWLGNFRLVLAYNVLFTVVSVICVLTHLTAPVRKQIMKKLNQLNCTRLRREESFEKIE